MKKDEFLRELRISLEGKLDSEDINEILSDYNDVFQDGILDNKTEDEISKSMGSPSAIAKNIVDDPSAKISYTASYNKDKNISNLASMGKRLLAHTIDSFLIAILFILLFMTVGSTVTGISNVTYIHDSLALEIGEDRSELPSHYKQIYYLNRKQNIKKVKLYKDNKRIFSGNMSSYKSFLEKNKINPDKIQTTETSAPLFAKSTISKPGQAEVITTYSYNINPAHGFPLRNSLILLPIFMILGLANIFTAFQLWIFNGYTLGKWLTKTRVVKSDGSKIGFLDAFLRDAVLKFAAGLFTSGILNIVSFVFGCVREDHKTIHDLAIKTNVIIMKG